MYVYTISLYPCIWSILRHRRACSGGHFPVRMRLRSSRIRGFRLAQLETPGRVQRGAGRGGAHRCLPVPFGLPCIPSSIGNAPLHRHTSDLCSWCHEGLRPLDTKSRQLSRGRNLIGAAACTRAVCGRCAPLRGECGGPQRFKLSASAPTHLCTNQP